MSIQSVLTNIIQEAESLWILMSHGRPLAKFGTASVVLLLVAFAVGAIPLVGGFLFYLAVIPAVVSLLGFGYHTFPYMKKYFNQKV